MFEDDGDLDGDLALAHRLQTQFDEEYAHEEVVDLIPEAFRTPSKVKNRGHNKGHSDPLTPSSLVAPEWEDVDPTPDLHALFLQFNGKFFWGRLVGCEVKWSPRMTVCAGVCSYQRRAGYCSIRLSVPLLKLRPRSDFVETLLHEMIHAYLFVTDGNDNHDGHGPAFHTHMHRINKEAGTKISVYHNFHDEVAVYKTHWWKCGGPCQHRRPFYGLVKRSMNRAPGPNDRWWPQHQATCGGTYTKIKEPEDYGKKKTGSKRKLKQEAEKSQGQKDIRNFVGSGTKPKTTNSSSAGSTSSNSSSASNGDYSTSSNGAPSSTYTTGGGRGNIFGFGGTSFAGRAGGGTALKNPAKSGTMVVGKNSRAVNNSSSGHVIGGGGGPPSTVTSSAASSSSVESGRTSSAITNLSGRASGSTSASTTNPSTAGAAVVDVRQSVRDAWAKRFAATAEKENLNSNPTATAVFQSPETKANNVNYTDKKSETAGTNNSNNSNKEKEDKTPCPVCSRDVPSSSINDHLDECLTRASLSEGGVASSSSGRNDAVTPDPGCKICTRCRREVLLEEFEFHRSVCS